MIDSLTWRKWILFAFSGQKPWFRLYCVFWWYIQANTHPLRSIALPALSEQHLSSKTILHFYSTFKTIWSTWDQSCWCDPGLAESARRLKHQVISTCSIPAPSQHGNCHWGTHCKTSPSPHARWKDGREKKSRACGLCILQAVSDRQVGGESCSARKELSTLASCTVWIFFFVSFRFNSCFLFAGRVLTKR